MVSTSGPPASVSSTRCSTAFSRTTRGCLSGRASAGATAAVIDTAPGGAGCGIGSGAETPSRWCVGINPPLPPPPQSAVRASTLAAAPRTATTGSWTRSVTGISMASAFRSPLLGTFAARSAAFAAPTLALGRARLFRAGAAALRRLSSPSDGSSSDESAERRARLGCANDGAMSPR